MQYPAYYMGLDIKYVLSRNLVFNVILSLLVSFYYINHLGFNEIQP